MTIKYRVHEVAKDFEVSSKEILDILSAHCEGEKKSMTALEANELDIVFDLLTAKHSIKNLKEYLESGKAARAAKKEAEPEEPKADTAADSRRAEQERILALLQQAKAAEQAEKKAKAEPEKKPAKATEKKAEPKKEAKKEPEKKTILIE